MTWGKGQQRVHFPYLLIESDDPALAVSDFTAFWEAGFNPAFCAGRASGRPCSLLESGECELVDRADVVLHRMQQRTGIADAIRESRPELPVVVIGTDAGADLPPTASIAAQTRTLSREVYRGKTWTRSVGALGFSK
jgi:hypothetical protein